MDRYANLSHQTIAMLFHQRCDPWVCRLHVGDHPRWYFLRAPAAFESAGVSGGVHIGPDLVDGPDGTVSVAVAYPFTEFERADAQTPDPEIVYHFPPDTRAIDVPVFLSQTPGPAPTTVFQAPFPDRTQLVWSSPALADRYEDTIVRYIHSCLVGDSFRLTQANAFFMALVNIGWPRTYKLMVVKYVASVSGAAGGPGSVVDRAYRTILNHVMNRFQPGVHTTAIGGLLSEATVVRYDQYAAFFAANFGDADAEDGPEDADRGRDGLFAVAPPATEDLVFEDARPARFLDLNRHPYEISRRLIHDRVTARGGRRKGRTPATLVALFDYLASRRAGSAGYANLVYWENKQFWKAFVRPRALDAAFRLDLASGTAHDKLQREILFELYGRPGRPDRTGRGAIPPIRLDYADTVVLDLGDAAETDPDPELDGLAPDANLMVLHGDELRVILRHYKTARQYGECEMVHADAALVAKIRRMLAMRPAMGVEPEAADFFLLNSKLAKMSRNGLSKYLKKYVGGSVNQLRKKYVVAHFGDVGAERRHAAESMQHSLNVQDRHYNDLGGRFYRGVFAGGELASPRGPQATARTEAILNHLCVINPFSEYLRG